MLGLRYLSHSTWPEKFPSNLQLCGKQEHKCLAATPLNLYLRLPEYPHSFVGENKRFVLEDLKKCF